MDYNTEEQEIDLKDLMFAVFHKWRSLILVAVICGLLLGGVKGFMTYKEQSDPEVRKEADLTYSADLELYEKNKDTYEKENDGNRTGRSNGSSDAWRMWKHSIQFGGRYFIQRSNVFRSGECSTVQYCGKYGLCIR